MTADCRQQFVELLSTASVLFLLVSTSCCDSSQVMSLVCLAHVVMIIWTILLTYTIGLFFLNFFFQFFSKAPAVWTNIAELLVTCM